MEGRIIGGRETWVRVGSEVEKGQVEFESVCVFGGGVGSLKGTGVCVCVCVIDKGTV